MEESTSIPAQMVILEVISPPSAIELDFQLSRLKGLNKREPPQLSAEARAEVLMATRIKT